MITLTQKAIDKVKDAIHSQAQPAAGIRVSVVGGGCSGYQYSMNLEQQARENDQVLQVDGFSVYVDEQSLSYLDGTEIDYVETLQGAGFKFNNPNVKSSCGCGESFQV